jgi:hypothetical protein
MFVLTAEGPAQLNKALWSTHVVLGVFDTSEEAIAYAEKQGFDEEESENVVLLTEIKEKHLGTVVRLFSLS